MKTKVPSMQDLLEAGAHFGHKVSRGNPRMKRYVYGARDGVQIVDLAKTEELLKEATEKAYQLGKDGKVMLLIGTKKQAQELIRGLAKEADTYYLVQKWVKGLFTNFEEIRKNIKKLLDLKEKQQKNQLTHYTKREQLFMSRKVNKFEYELGGVAAMEKLPDAIFVVDGVADKIAIKEARETGVKVLGISDTNADPMTFDYPVPANDDGIKSINLICETIIGAYIEGKKEAGIKTNEKKSTQEAPKEDNSEVATEISEAVAEEAAALEELVEKEVVEESSRKESKI
jgi:small subunit ribosomal protein S2